MSDQPLVLLSAGEAERALDKHRPPAEEPVSVHADPPHADQLRGMVATWHLAANRVHVAGRGHRDTLREPRESQASAASK